MTNPDLLSIETLPAPLAPEKPVVRCSFLPTIDACRGSLNASRGLESKSNAFSTFGDRVHAIMAHAPPADATAEERELADQMTESRREVVVSLLGCKDYETQYERHFKMPFLRFDLSGHTDFVALDDRTDTAVIDDAKTGFREVAQAATNRQGAGYVVLVWHNLGKERIFVNFTTRFGIERNPPAEYNFPDILAAKKQIETMVNEALEPDAKRTPSPDGCRYCPAKGTERCPETQQAVEWWGAMNVGIVGTEKKAREAYMRTALSMATPQQRALALEWYKIANPTLEVFYDVVREGAAREPGFIQGWEIQKYSGDRVIVNPFEALKALVAGGIMAEEELWAFVELQLPKIEKAYAAAQKKAVPKSTEKVAKKKIADVLGALIQTPGEKLKLVRSKDAPGTIDAEKKEK